MFNWNKTRTVDDFERISARIRAEEPILKQDTVSCEICKCLLKKDDAKEVNTRTDMGSLSWYYCQTHKKPYTRIWSGLYFGQVEMTEDGTPVGYVKKKI